MILSRQSEYGIRVMIEIARRDGGDNVTTSAIADVCRIPIAFLHKTVSRLVNAGLIVSRRGSGGGLTLARSPESISLLDIVIAIEDKLVLMDCLMEGKRCDMLSHCAVHSVLCETASDLSQRFRSITVAQLLHQQTVMDHSKPKRNPVVEIAIK